MGQKRLWVHSKKEFLGKVKYEVSALVGPLPKDLQKYSISYEKTFTGRWADSSKKELLRTVNSAGVILGGDFHAFNQAQRSHLRILREAQFEKPLVLALECIPTDAQGHIDKVYVGQVFIDDLPKLIDWQTHWPFPWEHYRPIVEWAITNGVRIIALGAKQKMSPLQFDRHMSKIIQSNFDPAKETLYVLVGELHLAEKHLPKQLKSLKRLPSKKIVLLHLDSEKLYFDLLKKKKENRVDVLRKANQQFCMLNSPPWVKWQSYLLYLEQTYDSDLERQEEGLIDLTDHVHRMIEILCMDLTLKIKDPDIHVINSMDRLMPKLIDKMERKNRSLAWWLIDQDRSFYEPRQKFLYLSRLSINHAAELAGAYIHASLAHVSRLYWKFPEDFERQIWMEGIVFMLSKMINHKRKPESLETLRTRLESVYNDPITKEVLLLSIEQRMLELMSGEAALTKRKRKIKPRKARVYHQAARILGQMLGERLFVQFRKSDFKSPRIIELLSLNPESSDFLKIYYSINRSANSQSSRRP